MTPGGWGDGRGTHAYVFLGRGWWGFTHDAAAADLPADRGPWSFFRNALIAEEGRTAEEEAVLADLRRDGFSVQPQG